MLTVNLPAFHCESKTDFPYTRNFLIKQQYEQVNKTNSITWHVKSTMSALNLLWHALICCGVCSGTAAAAAGISRFVALQTQAFSSWCTREISELKNKLRYCNDLPGSLRSARDHQSYPRKPVKTGRAVFLEMPFLVAIGPTKSVHCALRHTVHTTYRYLIMQKFVTVNFIMSLDGNMARNTWLIIT